MVNRFSNKNFGLRIMRLIVLTGLSLSLTRCSNVFTPMANKNSDEALYEDAVNALNDLDYDTSIQKFQALSVGFAARVEVRENYAGALAGKCGLSFSTFYSQISEATWGATPFFQVLMNMWTDKAVSPSFCKLAEEQIKLIWASATQTTSQQLFMVILSMGKMGAYIRSKADIDGASSRGDGATDVAFDACTDQDDANHLTDDEMREVITGFSLMLLNIAAFASGFGLGDTVDDINTACGVLVPNPCATTDAASVTDGMIESMRDLIATSSTNPTAPFGVGNCAIAAVPLCCP